MSNRPDLIERYAHWLDTITTLENLADAEPLQHCTRELRHVVSAIDGLKEKLGGFMTEDALHAHGGHVPPHLPPETEAVTLEIPSSDESDDSGYQ